MPAADVLDEHGPEAELRTCVYCKRSLLPDAFNREHVLPRAFGSFQPSSPVIECVCRVCNSDFGRRLDDPLARRLNMVRYEFAPNSKRGDQTRRNARIITGRDGATVTPQGSDFGMLPWTIRLDADAHAQVLVPEAGVRLRSPSGTEDLRPLDEMPRPHEVEKGTRMLVFGVDPVEAEALARAKGWSGEAESVSLTPDGGDCGQVVVEHDWTGSQVAAHAKIGLNFAAHSLGAAFVLKRQFDLVRTFIADPSSPYPHEWVEPIQQPVTTVEGKHPVGHLIQLVIALQPVRVVAYVALYNQIGFAIQLAREPWEGPLPVPGEWSMFFNPVGPEASAGQVGNLVRLAREPRYGEVGLRLACRPFR